MDISEEIKELLKSMNYINAITQTFKENRRDHLYSYTKPSTRIENNIAPFKNIMEFESFIKKYN